MPILQVVLQAFIEVSAPDLLDAHIASGYRLLVILDAATLHKEIRDVAVVVSLILQVHNDRINLIELSGNLLVCAMGHEVCAASIWLNIITGTWAAESIIRGCDASMLWKLAKS